MNHGIAIYARVSSDKQEQKGTIDSQIAAIKTYVKELCAEIDSDLIFIDNGVSGSKMERPALEALRDKVAAGMVAKIFVHSPDRLARKHIHQLLLADEFQRCGAELIYINRVITATPEDQLLLQVQSVIAEYEREKIIERSRRGKIHKAQQGKVSVLTKACFGYCYKRKGGNGDDATYLINLETTAIVRRIFDMFCKQSMTLRKIAMTLTAEQIPTQSHLQNWHPSSIWYILKNSAYVGQAAYRKRTQGPKQGLKRLSHNINYKKNSNYERPKDEWIIIPVPRILDDETFARAQDRLAENRRLSARNNKGHHYLLRGLLRCRLCGYALCGKTRPRKDGNVCYYRCGGLELGMSLGKKKGCSGSAVRAEVLEDTVWQATLHLLQQPKVVMAEYVRRQDFERSEQTPLSALVQTKNSELINLERQKQRLLDIYQTGAISLDDIEPRLVKMRSLEATITAERKLAEKTLAQAKHQLELLEQFESFRDRIGGNLNDLGFDKRQELIRLLVTEVEVDTKKYEITIKHIIPSEKKSLLCSTGRSPLGDS